MNKKESNQTECTYRFLPALYHDREAMLSRFF